MAEFGKFRFFYVCSLMRLLRLQCTVRDARIHTLLKYQNTFYILAFLMRQVSRRHHIPTFIHVMSISIKRRALYVTCSTRCINMYQFLTSLRPQASGLELTPPGKNGRYNVPDCIPRRHCFHHRHLSIPSTYPNLTACASETLQYSCENTTAVRNSCCSVVKGGLVLQTQLRNTWTGRSVVAQRQLDNTWAMAR